MRENKVVLKCFDKSIIVKKWFLIIMNDNEINVLNKKVKIVEIVYILLLGLLCVFYVNNLFDFELFYLMNIEIIGNVC